MVLRPGHFFRKHHGDDPDGYLEPPPQRVDWRWEVVQELMAMHPGSARARLEQLQDPALVDMFCYRELADTGVAHERELNPARDAYTIFMGDNPKARMLIEGLLICGATGVPLEQIEWANQIDRSAIDLYGEIFFDVRPRLQNWAWMFTMLFTSTLYDVSSSRDDLAKAHRIAWLCGPEVFTSFFKGGEMEWTEALKSAMQDRIAEMYYKQSFIQSFCAGRYGERDLKQIEFVINDIKADAAESMKGDNHADAVMAFLESTPIQVADPSLEANKQLPAREERVNDHLAIALQKMETAK